MLYLNKAEEEKKLFLIVCVRFCCTMRKTQASTSFVFVFALIFHFFLIISKTFCLLPDARNNQTSATRQAGNGSKMRVLALFSSATNDLGIDSRLGASILQLASEEALQLYNVSVKLVVRVDESVCDGLNKLPNIAADEYFFALEQQTKCANKCFDDVNDQNIMKSNKNTSNSIENWRTMRQSNDLAALDAYLSAIGKRRKRFSVVEEELDSSIAKLDAIIGPSCDFLVDLIARMAAYWHVPIYSVSSVSDQFSRKDIYKTLTRLSPSMG